MREYDAYIIRQMIKNPREAAKSKARSRDCCSEESNKAGATATVTSRGGRLGSVSNTLLLQRQIVKALLHGVTFSVAYLVMFLAMSYNVSLLVFDPKARRVNT